MMNDKDTKKSLIARKKILLGVVKELKNQKTMLGDVQHDDDYLLKHGTIESIACLNQPFLLLKTAINSLKQAIKTGDEINDRT